MYPEIASVAANWLQRNFGQPFTRTVPIGVNATHDFIREVAQLAGLDPEPLLARTASRARWYARSVDSTYLTGKRVLNFGDATHLADQCLPRDRTTVVRHERLSNIDGICKQRVNLLVDFKPLSYGFIC
jgi:hypothetical protein